MVFSAVRPQRPVKFVRLPAGGLGYFLTDSWYSVIGLYTGPDHGQMVMPPTFKSSCGSISML